MLVKLGLLRGEKIRKLEFCEHCVMGKQRKVKFGIAIHNTEGILDCSLCKTPQNSNFSEKE